MLHHCPRIAPYGSRARSGTVSGPRATDCCTSVLNLQIFLLFLLFLLSYFSMKRHHRLRFTWQVPGEDNSEGEYLRVRASGFRDRKFPMVIFSPKKRSGIAVRVGERTGTWQAKRPTTHKYRGKEKQPDGAVFFSSGNPNWLPPSHHIPTGHPPPASRNTSGRDKGFARSQLCMLQFLFPFCRPPFRRR